MKTTKAQVYLAPQKVEGPAAEAVNILTFERMCGCVWRKKVRSFGAASKSCTSTVQLVDK